MRKLLSIVASLTIVAGAYFWSFGVPDAWSAVATNSAATVQSSTQQRGPRSGGGGATTVVLTPLELQPYEDIFRAVGSSEAFHTATVSPDVPGRVIDTNLTSNTQVSQDDILVQLDARIETLNLETAQGELEQANDTVARYERLQQAGNATVTAVTISDARLAQRLAETNIRLAQLALEDRTIRAPISGTLGLSDVNVGDTISAGSVITTIDNSIALIVEFELPERSIGLLAVGREVLFGTPSFVGHVFKGEIVSFDSRIDSETRSVTVKARVENPDEVLWPGMTFTVRVINMSDPLAMLPATAVTWSRDGSSIWFDNEGVATSAPATILFRQNDQVWLDVDIPVGTMVVTEGSQKLRVGAAIVGANAEPDDPGGPRPQGGTQPDGTRRQVSEEPK